MPKSFHTYIRTLAQLKQTPFENIVAKVEIESFPFFYNKPDTNVSLYHHERQCFQKCSVSDASKYLCIWELVK